MDLPFKNKVKENSVTWEKVLVMHIGPKKISIQDT